MSTPSPNQTNDDNGSFSDNFSNINMFLTNNSELADYVSPSSSDDPSSPYMLEETPMSPGLDYYINEDMNRYMIDSSTNPHSYGSIYSDLADNFTMPFVDTIENVQTNMEATNMLLPSSFSGYGSHGTSANFHMRIPEQPSTVFSPHSFSNSTGSNVMGNTSAGPIFTQTQSTYPQFPPWDWIGYSLTGANEDETSISETNAQRFPENQAQQIMFAPESNGVPAEPIYVPSSLEEQYTNVAVANDTSSDVAQPIPSFPGIVPSNISNESNQPMIFGSNDTSRNLSGSNAWDGIPFQNFVQELISTIEQEHGEPQATIWRARILAAVHRALERMHEGTLAEGSLIVETLLNLMENVSGTPTTTAQNEHVGVDIENMSYEEILDLQESIGRVNTGLTEDQIVAGMMKYEYRTKRVTSSDDLDRCCICLDEYIDGQEVGKLNCVHEFHSDCIKEWLKQKNSCPICKRTGLTT